VVLVVVKQFTFDFLLLLLLASVIAFMGLVENSSVTLVASMLGLFYDSNLYSPSNAHPLPTTFMEPSI
jgi:hypothetical protein